MSIKLMSLVFDAQIPDLEYTTTKGKQANTKASTATLVLLAYADHANEYGEGTYPGYKKLLKKTKLSSQGLADTIRALKQNDLLTFEGRSRLNTNSYRINVEKLEGFLKPLEKRFSSHLRNKLKPLEYNHPSVPVPHPLCADAPTPSTENMPLEWKIVHDQKLSEDDLRTESAGVSKQDAQDAAFLISQAGNADLKELAMAFILAANILPAQTKADYKRWRAGLREMVSNLPNAVTPQNITDAVAQHLNSIDKNGNLLILESPHSIKKLAKSMANTNQRPRPAPEITRAPQSQPEQIINPDLLKRK